SAGGASFGLTMRNSPVANARSTDPQFVPRRNTGASAFLIYSSSLACSGSGGSGSAGATLIGPERVRSCPATTQTRSF
uniref:Uncharacterized protein n=1 Tax=Aegilops tauschii subsp. strangulata TaxID=200361 RepID=A0A452ZUS2_AEGTS